MKSILHIDQRQRHHLPVTLLVLSILFLASCVPAEPVREMVTATNESPTLTAPAPLTESTQSSPLASVTARGPDLVASDPASVSLASGGLQLIEFFRFT